MRLITLWNAYHAAKAKEQIWWNRYAGACSNGSDFCSLYAERGEHYEKMVAHLKRRLESELEKIDNEGMNV